MKKGFTLIELLVVIAIIAILAAILFPVFAQAREKARQSSCLSNLKNIGTAIMLYTDDNHETYPIARVDGGDGVPANLIPAYGYGYWPNIIYPYTKDWKIYYCPSYWTTYNKDSENPALDAISGGYMANSGVLGDFSTGVASQAKKLSRIKSPSNVVVVQDGWWYIGTGPGLTNCRSDWGYLPGAGAAGATPNANVTGDTLVDFNSGRHNEGCNLCYADGHAGYEKSADLYPKLTATSKNPWEPATW